MEINEVLDLVEYGLKKYRDNEYNVGLTLLDYYSITDLDIEELSKIAREHKRVSLAILLSNFKMKYYYLLNEVNLQQRLNSLYSLRGREMSNLDKLSLYEILIDRGYPTLTGVYDAACRYYASENLDNLNKESIRAKVKKAYCQSIGISFEQENTNKKPVVKTLTK